jgi:hypothetical protein
VSSHGSSTTKLLLLLLLLLLQMRGMLRRLRPTQS